MLIKTPNNSPLMALLKIPSFHFVISDLISLSGFGIYPPIRSEKVVSGVNTKQNTSFLFPALFYHSNCHTSVTALDIKMTLSISGCNAVISSLA